MPELMNEGICIWSAKLAGLSVKLAILLVSINNVNAYFGSCCRSRTGRRSIYHPYHPDHSIDSTRQYESVAEMKIKVPSTLIYNTQTNESADIQHIYV